MANAQWAKRIVGAADVPPGELVANDKNYRVHPQSQEDALSGAIGEVGFIRSVTVNKRSGKILDGHLRVALAVKTGQKTVPVEYVDLSEEEEAKALLTIDPLAAMADADAAKLESLMGDVDTQSDALQAMLDDLAGAAGVSGSDGDLTPVSVERPPCMTWVLVGIETVRFGEIAEAVERLALVPGVLCEVTANSDAPDSVSSNQSEGGNG